MLRSCRELASRHPARNLPAVFDQLRRKLAMKGFYQTRFEAIAGRKLGNRQLTEDANAEMTGRRDLREEPL
jgi:hypothetical protein